MKNWPILKLELSLYVIDKKITHLKIKFNFNARIRKKVSLKLIIGYLTLVDSASAFPSSSLLKLKYWDWVCPLCEALLALASFSLSSLSCDSIYCRRNKRKYFIIKTNKEAQWKFIEANVIK